MRDRALSARVLYRAVALLLLCALVLPPSPSLKAAPVNLSSSVTQLVDSFAATLNSNQSQQRKAAIAILQHYNEYKSLVATGKVDKSVARVLDEHLVQMCQETWRDVAVRQGSGLDHIVPVGTLGNRWENPAYIPGKSDKDFIPRGRSASEAVGDFNQAFEQRFGLSPASVDVNVLDPTDPSSWPGRYSAATNVEKYNTAGGNKWLAAEEYLQKPNLWRFDPASGTMREVYYEGVVKTPPPALTKGDALGWYSDNTRFRALLGDKVVEPELLALKQAKYDLRNADAFRLAGGTLSESDAAMLRATQLLRNGKPDAALGVMIQLTGETNPQRALAAYLRSMDELNSTMGRFIADSHVRLLSSSLANSKLTLQLTNEMAASIANLPRTQRVAAVEALVERFGKSKADEIVKLADVFERRAAWGLTYFDDAAMASFGKRYDQLTGAERAMLHGADEVAESFLSKAARVTGYVFSGYAIYNAYVQGAKHGTGTGIGSAIGRAFIEALQAGVPIVAIGELVAQLTAGAVQLGAAAYKNDVLESLYDLYKKEQNLDFLLDIQGALPYYSGGLRQLAIDLKMENPNITEAEIRQQIGDYFARRLQAEQAAEAMKARVQNLLDWLHARDIELVDATNVDGLSAEESQLIAGLLEAYQRLEEQFRRDGILANDENILAALWHLYHRAGTPESYEKFLRELYRGFGKRYPPAGQPRQCKDKPVIQTSRSATVIRAQAPQKTGQLLSVSGSFTERVDVACDPAPVVAPVEISAGGRISITVDGGSPVPCTWSIWNAGAGLAVDYIPQIGRNQGPAQRIAETSLTCESGEPSNTHVEMGGDVPGPGQLVAHVAVPGGCGALTCGCFEQSFSGQVTMVEVRADAAAQPGTELDNGDRVVTGDNGTTRLIVPGFASVTIRKNSDLTYVDTAAGESQAQATCGGAPALTLNQGSLRLRTVPGGQPMAVQVNGRTVLPEGTDYVVEATATGGRVTVFTGAVTIEDSDGKTVTVLAGQSFEWPGDVMSDAQIRAEDVASEEAPYADLLLDDTTPAPYGDWPATFSGEQMPAQWVWSDPGQDATWTSPGPDTIQVTAPDGNALWSQQATAPLLLRKVTGDFDLEGELLLESAGLDYAVTEFLLYAPGAMLGALGGQMYWDSATVDLRVLGGGWVKSQGKDKLATLDCLDSAFDRCEDAPAVPVQFRLTRRGDVWRTYRWVDGTGWTLTSQQQLAAPETLWIGWVFKRAASDGLHDAPAISTLRNVRVVNAPLGAMAPPAWDLMEPAGTDVLENGVRLALDGTHTGTVEAQAGQQLEGDFDVVVRVEIPGWTRQPGETRVLGVAAVAMDNQSRAYVAFSETETRRIFNSDMQINNGWYRWREVSSDESPATWLRITRIDDRVTTAYWGGCKWRPFQEFADPFPYPVFVRPFAGNEWEATAPAAVAATFTIEHMAQGAATRELAPWEPAGCSVITAADLPPTLALPAGVSAAAWTAPLTLGRVFFDDQGMAYVFSNDLIKRHLLSVGADGVARYWMESDLVAGLNRKSGVWNGASLLVAIDYWPEGGNPFSGIQELASDGSVRAWETVTSFGGVTDMLPAPDGGWLLADFEQDNVFYLPAEGAAALPLITEGERPAGLWALAAGASSGTLYALNRSGDPPYGGVAGIYKITDTGEARLVAQPPEGAANFGGIAVADGRVFARGLYATVPDGNQVVRVRESGTLEPVLEDIPAPRELAFDPLTGDLMVVYAGNMLLRVTAVSAPAVTPPEAPAQSGPPPPSPAPLAAVIHILEIEAPAQTAAGEMFGITVRYGWDVGAAATVGIRAEGGAATRDAPGSPASVTGRGEATASLAIFAPDVAGPHTFAVEAYALLANGSEQIDRRRVTVNLVAAPAPIPDPQAVPPADPAAQPPPDPAGDATTKVVATPESVPLATPALAAIPTLAPTPTFAPTPTPTAPATAFQPVSDAVNVFFTIRTDGSPWAYVVDKQGREVYPQAGVPVVTAEVRPGDLLVLHTDARAFSLLFDCGVNPRSFSPCDFAAAAPGELPAQIWVNDGSDSAYLNLSGPDNWGDLRPNFAGQRYPADPVFRVVIRK